MWCNNLYYKLIQFHLGYSIGCSCFFLVPSSWKCALHIGYKVNFSCNSRVPCWIRTIIHLSQFLSSWYIFSLWRSNVQLIPSFTFLGLVGWLRFFLTIRWLLFAFATVVTSDTNSITRAWVDGSTLHSFCFLRRPGLDKNLIFDGGSFCGFVPLSKWYNVFRYLVYCNKKEILLCIEKNLKFSYLFEC